MKPLILKRASASRLSGQWRDDDYDVLENGVLVGRIFKVPVAPRVALGCGRAATTGTYAGRRMATSRLAKPRWRRSQRAGGASNGRPIGRPMTVVIAITALSHSLEPAWATGRLIM